MWRVPNGALTAVHYPDCPPNGQETQGPDRSSPTPSDGSFPNVRVTYTASRGGAQGRSLTVEISGPIPAEGIKLRARMARAAAEDAMRGGDKDHA